MKKYSQAMREAMTHQADELRIISRDWSANEIRRPHVNANYSALDSDVDDELRSAIRSMRLPGLPEPLITVVDSPMAIYDIIMKSEKVYNQWEPPLYEANTSRFSGMDYPALVEAHVQAVVVRNLYGSSFGRVKPTELWEGHRGMEVLRNYEFYVNGENQTILSGHPTRVFRNDEGQYHLDGGPAIEYADGFGAFCWRGQRVREDAVTCRDFDMHTIRSVLPAVKRAMVERAGDKWMFYQGEIIDVTHRGELRGVVMDSPVMTPGWFSQMPQERAPIYKVLRVVDATARPDGQREVYYKCVPPRFISVADTLAWLIQRPEFNPEFHT
jgi:hypothetical protein